MSELRALSLLPFVPSGADYDGSRRLFADLGFDEIWEHNGYAGFRNGPAQFILQRFDNPTFAGNFMIRLNVPDLDAWWRACRAVRSSEGIRHFGSRRPPSSRGDEKCT